MKSLDKLRPSVSHPATIIAIDSSTRSVAACVIRREESGVEVEDTYKLDLEQFKAMSDKINHISRELLSFISIEDPDAVVIEQTIYIQNPATSRKLSYVVGAIWATANVYCENIQDVTIQEWKSFIGYKNISKKEKDEWAKTMTPTEVKKKTMFERKERTRNIVHEHFPETAHIDDDDICDAIGIAIWAASHIET